MKIMVTIESGEIDSPIRFAAAVIERCMDVTNCDPDIVMVNYKYLCEVNEHIDTFIRHFNYDELINNMRRYDND